MEYGNPRGARSSAVERPAHNWLRVGSNPTGPILSLALSGRWNDAGMQGTVILRLLAVFTCITALCGCHFNTRNPGGETPAPSNTTLAQANSTAAPDQMMSKTPAAKYIAKTGADLKGVTFAVWANGRPIGSVQWPNKALDITPGMRGHANVLVIEWTRTTKNGSGTMTISTAPGNKLVLTAHVTPSSAAKGRVSKTIIAPQAPVGRPSPGP